MTSVPNDDQNYAGIITTSLLCSVLPTKPLGPLSPGFPASPFAPKVDSVASYIVYYAVTFLSSISWWSGITCQPGITIERSHVLLVTTYTPIVPCGPRSPAPPLGPPEDQYPL